MNRLIAIINKAGLTLQVFKTALAAAAAWLAATTLFPGPYPYFAPLAAILTVQVTVARSLKAALQRFAGIVVGVIISILIGYWLPIGSLSIFIMILLGLAVANVLHLSPQVTSQIGMTSLLVLAISQGKGPAYAIGRIIETLVGSVVAILINALIIPPDAVPAAEKQVLRLSALAADTLSNLGLILDRTTSRDNQEDSVESLIKETGRGIGAIRLAEDSLKYSPLTIHSRRKLETLAVGMQRLEYVTIQIRGIRKGLLDIDPRVLSPAGAENLKAALAATAACLHCYGKRVVDPSAQNKECLTFSIAEARAKQRSCLMDMLKMAAPAQLRDLGGILTDLDRIVEGVAEEP